MKLEIRFGNNYSTEKFNSVKEAIKYLKKIDSGYEKCNVETLNSLSAIPYFSNYIYLIYDSSSSTLKNNVSILNVDEDINLLKVLDACNYIVVYKGKYGKTWQLSKI